MKNRLISMMTIPALAAAVLLLGGWMGDNCEVAASPEIAFPLESLNARMESVSSLVQSVRRAEEAQRAQIGRIFGGEHNLVARNLLLAEAQLRGAEEMLQNYAAMLPEETVTETLPGLVQLDLSIEQSGEVIDTARLLVDSGKEDTYSRLTEIVYPSDYAAEVNADGTVKAVPKAWTKQYTGVSVKATPALKEGGLVEVRISASFTSEPVWQTVLWQCADANGVVYSLAVEQPYFPCNTLESALAAPLGTSTPFDAGAFRITVTPTLAQ